MKVPSLHPLVKLALEAENSASFNHAITEYEATSFTADVLGSAAYTRTHLSQEEFTAAINNPKFDWDNYYEFRKPIHTEVFMVNEALISANCQTNTPMQKTFVFFCKNHPFKLLELKSKTNLKFVLSVLCSLPIEETKELPFWKQLSLQNIVALYFFDIVKNLPPDAPLRQNQLFQELDLLYTQGVAPVSFSIFEVSSLLVNPTPIISSYLAEFILSNKPLPRATNPHEFNAFLPCLLACIEQKTITATRLAEFECKFYGGILKEPELVYLNRIIVDKEATTLLQQGAPKVALSYIGYAPANRYDYLKANLDIDVFNKDGSSIAAFLENVTKSQTDKICQFFLTEHNNAPFNANLITALRPHQYPLELVHLPNFSLHNARESMRFQFTELTPALLTNLFGKRPQLFQALWLDLSGTNKHLGFIDLCIKASVLIPLKWLRTKPTADVILATLSQYTQVKKHPRYLRIISYSYAIKQVDLSQLFPAGSEEYSIIKRLLSSSALKE